MGILSAIDAIATLVDIGRGNKRSLEKYLRAIQDGEIFLDFDANKLPIGPGTGITTGVGAIAKSSVQRVGEIIHTRLLLDLTGLTSADSDLDVIGVEDTALPCHIGRITAARNGTILTGFFQCGEAPASLTDIGIYSTTSGILVYEDLITDETGEVVIVTPAVQATANGAVPIAGVPVANDYLYIVNGAADTPADFTVGKFVLDLFGYVA